MIIEVSKLDIAIRIFSGICGIISIVIIYKQCRK